MRRLLKNKTGSAVNYISQKQAMRRLQIGLSNFRRICILKGIYPVEPKNRKKAGRGSTKPAIYFHSKDIAFLAREPLIETFRVLRVHQRRLKKAREKMNRDAEFRLRMNKPTYTLHQLVKERYPTRKDALRDLNNSLNLLFLFARLPRLSFFHPALISLCRRLCVEFLHYIIASRSVRKAFISIKGFYLEIVIDEVPIVWVIPHQAATHAPMDVDYRLLATCVEFDATLLGSLLCNLYKKAGLLYPPKIDVTVHDPESCYCAPTETNFEQIDEGLNDNERFDSLTELQTIDDSVAAAINKQIQMQKIKHLFDTKRFFLNREVPKEVLCVIIRSCGGECSWDVICGPGATFVETDTSIDYQIVDRPMTQMSSHRAYVQPQWVFDSLNSGRLLPTQDYLPSAILPPHLSPFASQVIDRSSDLPDAIKQAATIAPAPGFGPGSAMYRPPEADYFAGLVSLAEIRGTAVAATAKRLVNEDSGGGCENTDDLEKSHDDAESTSLKKSKKRHRKLNSMKVAKVVSKGKAVVTSGRVESALTLKMTEKAEANAQRKLRELMLPKRHKNLYKKMLYSQKAVKRDVRQLSERRKVLQTTPEESRTTK